MIVTAVGNAGFRIEANGRRVFVDAPYQPIPGVADPPDATSLAVGQADLLFFTHAHPDHFDPAKTLGLARRTGALVAGPRQVALALQRLDPSLGVFCADPPPASKGQIGAPSAGEKGGIHFQAFRTFHGQEHLSWLVDMGGCRFLHDGDNEDSRGWTRDLAGRLDALFIAPWQGSGWDRTIVRLGASRWFLIHVTAEEIRAHEAGRYLPELTDSVPPGCVCLRPGRSWTSPG